MLTAEENMELPLRLAGIDVDKAWKDELVALIGLGNRLHHRPPSCPAASSSASPSAARS